MPTTEFRVPDMRCEGCERSVRDALDVAGVREVRVALSNGTVSVAHEAEAVTREELAERIRGAGFSPSPAGGEEVLEHGRAPDRPGRRYALLVLAVAALASLAYAGYVLYPRFDLPPLQGAGLLLLAAGAGVASFFSPCAFPLLVTLLARETGADERGRGGAG